MKTTSDLPEPYKILLYCTIGFFYGLAVLFLGFLYFHTKEGFPYIGFGFNDELFASILEVKFWFLLTILQAILWGAVCAYLWHLRQSLKRRFENLNRKSGQILLWILLFFPLVLPPLVFAPKCQYAFTQYHSGIKTTILGFTGFMIVLLVGVAILLVDFAIRSFDGSFSADKEIDSQKSTDLISKYLQLKENLSRLLLILAAMLSSYTLFIDAKRRAIIASQGYCTPAFTLKHVLLYALYFSAMIAIAYFPVYVNLLIVGRKLCDELLPMPPPQSDSWMDKYEQRKKLEGILQLKLTTIESIQSGLGILAPVVSYLLSLWIGGK
jgi:hypothetical protein